MAVPLKPDRTGSDASGETLVDDLRSMIDATRSAVASKVDMALTGLYWHVGSRIHVEILRHARAEYGGEVIKNVATRLAFEYGQSYNEKNLRRMIQFAVTFDDEMFVVSLIRQLSWTHFLALIPLKQLPQRTFYAEMCRLEGWSVRTLRQKISGMLYERTAISKRPEILVQQSLSAFRDNGNLTPELVFRNPYVLDFLGLRDTYSERDLEAAILRELETFLLELGGGFAFVARQKRMVIDQEDHTLDLLLYHRRLRRLVAVELKLGRFKAIYKGQMELYMRWLEAHEQEPGEESPLGLILCAEASREAVELLQLDRAGIHVAEYLTELPPREILQARLRTAINHARAAFAQDRHTERR